MTQQTERFADRIQDHRPPARLTGRGAVLRCSLIFLARPVAELLHLASLAGFGFRPAACWRPISPGAVPC